MTLSQGSEAGGPQSAKKTGSAVPCSTKVVGRGTPSDSAKPNRIQICALKK